MRIAKSALLILSGVAAGVVFVISCGDNLHVIVDAAVDAPVIVDAVPVCECPDAEPPLAGRFAVFSQLQTIPGNDTSFQSVACPMGSQFISGSCTTDVLNPIRNVTLQQSGFFGPATGWNCFFRNNDPTPVTIRVSTLCLEPAL